MSEVPEQYKTLLETLKTMGIVPKADTPADLEKWMIAYLETKEGKFVKAETKDKGLKPELKANCHYEKERFKGFDELRVALRKLEKENEIDVGSRTAHVKQAVVQEKDEVQGMLKQITHRLNNLELQSRVEVSSEVQQPTGQETEAVLEEDIGVTLGDQKVNIDHNNVISLTKAAQPQVYEERSSIESIPIRSRKLPPGLCGEPTEATILVNGIETKALIDTGSTISTMSKKFYLDYFQHVPIEDIGALINIECADGKHLPYEGCIAVDLQIQDMDNPVPSILLIIPDSPYNLKVPVLLGTNILNTLMETFQRKHGDRYLDKSKLTTPWYLSFRSILLREKELRRNNFRLGLVRSAEKNTIRIQPNSRVIVRGYINKALPYQQTLAMLQPTIKSRIDNDIDIEPSLIEYKSAVLHPVDVYMSNITTRTVTILPKEILCEIQPVTETDLEPPVTKTEGDLEQDVLNLITMDEENLSPDEIEEGKQLIESYRDIFSRSDTDVGQARNVYHKIELEDDRNFKQRYRRIPPAMINEVREHLKLLLRSGIIRKSHSPWSSNVVLVKKKDNSLRLCIDFRQLNKKTKDAYALPRIEEMLDCLAGNKYFSVLDLKSGYHQVEIFEPHKERTAFTVGPLGLYEFNRMPFGLTGAPATYQRLMQETLGDLHLKICCIFIDDIIVFSSTFQQHLERLKLVFDRIRAANLKLSPKKCSLFKRKVKYVGHVVSSEGVETDPDKISKVVDWPTPTNPEEIRKFIGFAGYFRRFIQNFSQISKPLTELFPSTSKKKKKKIVKEWEWGEK
ncbi:uncharacterized protein LOC134268467 [Saccostrea cucullata]|uniref:uncharacterized protein LOC134268467 n=1 Tax=Saccostrea cuccullata TaxID=36930 RepID=UPI002ED02273